MFVANQCQIRLMGSSSTSALSVARPATDLLVVGDGRTGRAQVHHEAQVGFVEAHAQRARGDQGLDAVGQQRVLGLDALGRVGAPRVGPHVVAGRDQHRRRVLGGRDREAVDDAAAGERAEVLPEPGEPAPRRTEIEHPEAQRTAGQAA
jgi:hypothetical protein